MQTRRGKGLGADSEEKHEPVSDIDTVVVDSLKALDPEWPIREADVERTLVKVSNVPRAVVAAVFLPNRRRSTEPSRSPRLRPSLCEAGEWTSSHKSLTR